MKGKFFLLVYQAKKNSYSADKMPLGKKNVGGYRKAGEKRMSVDILSREEWSWWKVKDSMTSWKRTISNWQLLKILELHVYVDI